MKYCDKCKVKIAGDREKCPLCQGMVTDIGGPSREVFPKIPTVYRQHNLLFRLLIFASIVAGVVSVAINLLLPQAGWWSLFVLLGIGCMWVSLFFAVRKRHNIPKNIMYQVVFVSGLSVIWDLVTHWRGWSIDYVIPSACFLAMISLAVLFKVMKMPVRDYLIYFALDGLFGIVPIIFFLTGCLNVLYPSLICVAVSVISLAALAVFAGENMLAELKRRLHL